MTIQKKASIVISLLFISTQVWSFSAVDQGRRAYLKKLVTASSSFILISRPQQAISSNLPPSNGGDLSKTGSLEKLTPIASFQQNLLEANALLANIDSSSSADLSKDFLMNLSSILRKIPDDEKIFKRYFDEYSDPVSYKQKYMEKNAFLVYYTNGFDGPGRDSIESGEVPRQVLQYGARNECWNAVDELNIEVKFGIKDGSSSRDDISVLLSKAITSFDAYLSLAPKTDVEKALATTQ
jgi:hypothetical protein